MISTHFLNRFLLSHQHFLFLLWKVSTGKTGNETPQALGVRGKSPFPPVETCRPISCPRKWPVSSIFPVWFPGDGV